MVRIISTSKIRRKMAEVVNQADEHGEPIYLTNYDEPKAVLIGYRAWEGLIEHIEDLEDALSFHERQGESARPFEEYLAERAEREQGSPQNEPNTLPAVAVAVR
jgi:prevent-host-death family protein